MFPNISTLDKTSIQSCGDKLFMAHRKGACGVRDKSTAESEDDF